MKRLLSFSLMLFTSGILFCQVNVEYISSQKKMYGLGEKIELNLKIKARPETCLTGMNRVKTYVSGLKIEKLSEWKELQKGIWAANITLTVIDNKKKTAKLTIIRKTDKDDIFHQEIFNLN